MLDCSLQQDKKYSAKKKWRWDKIHHKKLDKPHSERRFISKPKYGIAKNIINKFSP